MDLERKPFGAPWICHRASNHCMFNDRPGTSWIPLAIYPCSVLALYPPVELYRLFFVELCGVWTCDPPRHWHWLWSRDCAECWGPQSLMKFFSLLKEGDQVFQKKLGTNWEPINIYHHTTSNIGHQLFLGLQFFAADFPGSEAWTMLYTMLGCDGRWARA